MLILEEGVKKRVRKMILNKRSPKATQVYILPLDVEDLKAINNETLKWGRELYSPEVHGEYFIWESIQRKQKKKCASLNMESLDPPTILGSRARQGVKSMNPSGHLWLESGVLEQAVRRVRRRKGNESTNPEKTREIFSCCCLYESLWKVYDFWKVFFMVHCVKP